MSNKLYGNWGIKNVTLKLSATRLTYSVLYVRDIKQF